MFVMVNMVNMVNGYYMVIIWLIYVIINNWMVYFMENLKITWKITLLIYC